MHFPEQRVPIRFSKHQASIETNTKLNFRLFLWVLLSFTHTQHLSSYSLEVASHTGWSEIKKPINSYIFIKKISLGNSHPCLNHLLPPLTGNFYVISVFSLPAIPLPTQLVWGCRLTASRDLFSAALHVLLNKKGTQLTDSEAKWNQSISSYISLHLPLNLFWLPAVSLWHGYYFALLSKISKTKWACATASLSRE